MPDLNPAAVADPLYLRRIHAPADSTRELVHLLGSRALRYCAFDGEGWQLGVEDAGHAQDAFLLPEPLPRPQSGNLVFTWFSENAMTLQLQQLLDGFSDFSLELVAAATLAARADRQVFRFEVRGDAGCGDAEREALRRWCLAFSEDHASDLVVQSAESCRLPKLACFDMDSTLIRAEVIDELAAVAGVGEQVAAITAAAMRGELDFQQSFRKRMGLLEGFTEDALASVADRLPLMAGAQQLLATLQRLGCRNAVLSGGFTYFAIYLRENKLALDYVRANELEFRDGQLTGGVIEPIVDGEAKAAHLQAIAAELGAGLDEVIAVGDGANDLPMLGLGALGIAIHAKPKVRAEAPQAISHFPLDVALYLFGLSDRDF
ncbi:phosphoserine phosphatase SerB [Biformimicrobium ophioploci]|uniref:Phosphoserine phosphatase n=1 Tax=Biformimicrobium ophioploci TaxID=3036711 RepID=A0ABQ6LUR3_9GAMM|nr:phosphoserine phosphatase SerB [Microbulbifer sp. NKW57]GMG85800.1 hypothetical protein MNKW57_01210 [Microbulbifer sp. NKW57]